MRTSARYQEAINLLDEVLKNLHIPCDRFIVGIFKNKRYIGSHDRRFIKDLVYDVMRQWPALDFYCGLDSSLDSKLNGRLAMILFLHVIKKVPVSELSYIFDGTDYGPAYISKNERLLLEKVAEVNSATREAPEEDNLEKTPDWALAASPAWLWPSFVRRFGEEAVPQVQALNHKATVDIRVNTLKATPEKVLQNIKFKDADKGEVEFSKTPFSPVGIRLYDSYNLQDSPLWQNGEIEVQDEGSQLIALLANPKPGMRVLDMCAGAGGKTLAMAAIMQNKGSIVATDIHDWRLQKCRERLRKSGANNVECRLLENGWLKRQVEKFDLVLVDAPCSGTGTWRRNPDLKLKFTSKDLAETIEKQRSIIADAVKLVKKGGTLVYATCSVLGEENEDQLQYLIDNGTLEALAIDQLWGDVIGGPSQALTKGLLKQEGGGSFLQLTPLHHQTDGFFVSILKKIL